MYEKLTLSRITPDVSFYRVIRFPPQFIFFVVILTLYGIFFLQEKSKSFKAIELMYHKFDI